MNDHLHTKESNLFVRTSSKITVMAFLLSFFVFRVLLTEIRQRETNDIISYQVKKFQRITATNTVYTRHNTRSCYQQLNTSLHQEYERGIFSFSIQYSVFLLTIFGIPIPSIYPYS